MRDFWMQIFVSSNGKLFDRGISFYLQRIVSSHFTGWYECHMYKCNLICFTMYKKCHVNKCQIRNISKNKVRTFFLLLYAHPVDFKEWR